MSIWTDGKDDTLKLRVSQGAPYSVIGDEIGCSRNAVAGRVHRLGLKSLNPVSLPGLPSKAKAAARTFIKNREIKLVKQSAPPPMPVEEPIEAIQTDREPDYIPGISLNMEALEFGDGRCRWPVNEPARGEEYAFCGDPNVGGGHSYCMHHLRRSMSEDAFRRLRIAA